MFTKKTMIAFNKAVEETLINYSAKKVESRPDGYFEYQLQTDAGLLSVSCHEPEKSGVFSIYLRFSDYRKALSVLGYIELGMNAKWNIHSSTATIEEMIQYLNHRLYLVNAVNHIPVTV